MLKKIVAVNAGPRKGWNTDTLVCEAARGAAEAGADVVKFDMYRLPKYSGCVACFGCMRGDNKGRCVCRDGLTPVLDAIREADGLIIGSPNYLGDVTAAFRALYERLIFQAITYQTEMPTYNTRSIPVLLIMTTNCPEDMYRLHGYDKLMERYRDVFSTHVGPAQILMAGETLQVMDYSRYDWTYFDPEDRKKRHETVFPAKKAQAYRIGAEMVTGTQE